MWEDYLKLALQGIAARKLRSLLTMVGVFIGIMAVVALVSLGQGLQLFIDEQFEKVGGDRIAITPGGGGFLSGAPGSGFVSARLYDKDLDVVRDTSGVDQAIGIIFSSSSVEFNKKTRFVTIYGVPTEPEYVEFLKDFDYFNMENGRYLKEGDRYSALVGPNTGENFFNKELKIGDKLIIDGMEFKVVGVTEESGNPAQDQRLVLPIDTLKDVFNKTDYSMISAKAEKGSQPSVVADRITEKLRKSRNVREDEEDFSVTTSESIVEAFKNVFNIVTTVLAGIAAISLVVGGVGIMTTMYTSVLERTRQIGVMKSVGARNSDILLIFMTEAGIIGFFGGLLGIGLGLGLAKIGEILVHYYGLGEYSMYAGPELIAGAMAFSIIVGCVSGFLPSRRASLMNPVEALRYR